MRCGNIVHKDASASNRAAATLGVILVVLAAVIMMPACEEGTFEEAGEEIDEVVEDAGEAIEDAGDEIKDTIDDSQQ